MKQDPEEYLKKNLKIVVEDKKLNITISDVAKIMYSYALEFNQKTINLYMIHHELNVYNNSNHTVIVAESIEEAKQIFEESTKRIKILKIEEIGLTKGIFMTFKSETS